MRRMDIMHKDMESAAADHDVALVRVRTAQEFQAFEEESKQAADTFLGETKKLQAALSSRDEELSIVHARLSASEISRVKA